RVTSIVYLNYRSRSMDSSKVQGQFHNSLLLSRIFGKSWKHTSYVPYSLNNSSDLVRSQILLMDPLPQINEVFSTLFNTKDNL
ncbi:hypothetical protein L195_g049432, partial [Trifolium pratense]